MDDDAVSTELPQWVQQALDRARSSDEVEMLEDALTSLYDQRGARVLQRLARTPDRSAGVAWAVVDVASRREVDLLTLFSADELLSHAVRFVELALEENESESFDHEWAWYSLWYGCLTDSDRWDLVLSLLGRVPPDDHAFWLIGDGPLSELQMQHGGADRLEALAKTSPRLRRVLEVVNERP